MGRRFANILETVGNTPVVRVNKLAPADVNLYVKIEAFNPLGSVKDRLALGVIEDAERRGTLKPGQTVVEATSGNTGIGLAMVCAAKGYPLVVTMAETFSVERRKLMRFLGAKVVLTPASQRGMGMVNKANELAETNGWFLTRQFENEANADMHSRTTAREIIEDFKDTQARLLGHRLRHRRHAEGCGTRAGEGDAEHQDRGVRTGGRGDAEQWRGPATQRGRLTGDGASRVQAASDAGLGAGLHPEADSAMSSRAADPQDPAHRRPRRAAVQQGSGAEGRHLRRHHRRCARSPARCRSVPRRRRERTSWRCCPIPASAISARRCSPTSRRT